MDLGLTPAQKLSTLQGTKNGLANEIYTLLVRIGVDPDTFDSSQELPDDPIVSGEKMRLQSLLSALQLVEGKIAELS